MTRSLEDPVFGGRIATVTESLDYRVELGGQTTPTFHITIFEYPRLERAECGLQARCDAMLACRSMGD
jgi:hypothetical protein